MSERVYFLRESGRVYDAEIDAATLQALRAGYPMKGWPYPWREVLECTDGDCERQHDIMVPCCIGPAGGHIKDYKLYHETGV